MRPFGYSTGALAYGDFDRALRMLDGLDVEAIELSALRVHELPRLLDFSRQADLSRFSHISVHAPTDYACNEEVNLVEQLGYFVEKGWPIIAHPDVISDYSVWRHLGPLLCIENMDKRKPIGRTVEELERIFEKLPEAQMCFDIAHARQVDTSMTEAYRLAKVFHGRIKQIHISVVSTSSKHDVISTNVAHAFHEVSYLIPSTIPAILETPVNGDRFMEQLREQLEMAKKYLDIISYTHV
jgi:hypothetical protein